MNALPCPFCGGQPGVGWIGQPATKIYIACQCGARGPATDKGASGSGALDVPVCVEHAVELWNSRLPLASLDQRIQEAILRAIHAPTHWAHPPVLEH